MNKTAFVISIVLTTFVLMAFGGVVYALRAPEAALETQSVEENSFELAPTTDPSLEQTLLEREAIYQQRIAEANARLEQAQQQLAAQSALASPQSNIQVAGTQITSEQAVQIAAEFLGNDDVYWVETVAVRGEELYLVTFTSGELVYVNMTGQVVGSAPSQFISSSGRGGGGGFVKADSGSSGGGGEHEEREDHEDEHEDEDEDD